MKKILTTDDIRKALLQQEAVFLRNNIVLLSASTAAGMLEVHRREKADLIIARLHMPDAAGDRFFSAIRRDETLRQTGLIMICPADKESLGRGLAAGANAVVAEPVDIAGLFRRIAELLDIATREGLRELVKTAVAGSAGRDHFYSSSVNISSTGMLIETGRELKKGDRITCSVVLDRPLSVNAEVVRTVTVKPGLFRYGVRFLDLDPKAKADIMRYIRERRQS